MHSEINFHLDTYLLRNDTVYKITFAEIGTYKQIRPILSNGEAFIHHSTYDAWINAKSGWGGMPVLSSSMYIKFYNLPKDAKLSFELKDMHTNEIVKSTEANIYSYENLSSIYMSNIYFTEYKQEAISSISPDKKYDFTLNNLVLFFPIIIFFILSIIMRKSSYAKKMVTIANIDVVYLSDFFYPWGND